MKAVRSVLLGTAAGLLAVAGAQAADMPVKAKPVEYVKVCSLYGAGFYYIPGTDTCIKVGGYLRVQAEMGGGAGGIVYGSGPQMAGQARYTRDLTNDVNYRVRGVVSFDARNQTEYGTLRSYIRAGWENTTPAATGGGTTPSAFWERAFIQFAGFTVGRAQSFFDMFTYGGAYTYLNVRTSGDTGASGQNLWAYTVQFGNGVSYSLSFEDPATRKVGTCDATTACWAVNGGLAYDPAFAVNGAPGAAPTAFGFRVPDIITNLRIDQAWGYAGISTAIHDASGAYFGTPNNVNNGHPADKYGWAFSASGLLNLPGNDIVGVNFVWSKGAPGFATNSNAWQIYNSSSSVGIGWLADGIFDSTAGRQDIQLTEAWSINAAYQHIWGAAGTFGGKWRTTVYGGYVKVSYNDQAKEIILSHLPGAAGTRPCGVPVAGAVWPPLNIAVGSGNSCSPDFSFYQIGSRTQFNPHPLMDIGLDVVYTRLNTAFKGASTNIYPANGSRPAVSVIDDQSVLMGMVRWQRNFYP